jgi:hypothetical protein
MRDHVAVEGHDRLGRALERLVVDVHRAKAPAVPKRPAAHTACHAISGHWKHGMRPWAAGHDGG